MAGNTQPDYDGFIASKTAPAATHGRDVARSEIHGTLYDFQRDIVAWALRRGRAAIFADCGLGKTLMQLEWARHVPGDVLILAPLAVAEQTVREAEMIGLQVGHVRDGAEVSPGVSVTNYHRIHRFDLSRFDGVVLDESSILKSFDGKTRTALIDGFAHTRYRLACTATPSPNDYAELGNHSEFLGVMNYSHMLATFFVHDSSDVHVYRLRGHARNSFWDWIASWAAVLRTPTDLGYDGSLFELPSLNVHRSIVDAGTVGAEEDTLFEMRATTMQERRTARRTSIVERCELAASIANADPTEPFVLWCGLNAESELLTRLVEGAVEVRGSMTIDQKESALADFSAGRARAIVTKPSIAGHGLNWQHCRRSIFVGLSDSWEDWYQAVRRVWRFGQKRDVDVHVVTAAIEGNVVANINRKERDAAQLFENLVRRTAATVAVNLSENVGDTPMEYDETVITDPAGMWDMVHGDCLEALRREPDDHIRLSVFSPPFADLYVYSDAARDMGNCSSVDEFVEHMGFMVNELLRATLPGRMACVHCMNLPSTNVRDGVIGLKDFRGDLIRLFQGAGWVYHSEVVIWKDPVTAMQRTKSIGLLYKQLRKNSGMSRQGIPDTVLTFRKPGENPDPITHTHESFPLDQWQEWASPVWTDINQGRVLPFRAVRHDDDERHLCPLQLDVIERLVRLWSNPGDLVYSPFAGVGSEGYIALREGRRFSGVELKKAYADQAVANLREALSQLSLAV